MTLPVFAGDEPTTEVENKRMIEKLAEVKKEGVNLSILGLSMVSFGGVITSKGGPEIAGLGFGLSVAGLAVSAYGCYINFAAGRQLKRFLEDHKIELQIE